MTNFIKKYVSLAVIAVLTICQACDSDKIGGTGSNVMLVFRNVSSRPGGGLYLLKLDEGQPMLIADTASLVTCPAVSPDGKRIAFKRGQSIAVMDVDGANLKAVTSTSFLVPGPTNRVVGPVSTSVAILNGLRIPSG